jgi:hypothetical protein
MEVLKSRLEKIIDALDQLPEDERLMHLDAMTMAAQVSDGTLVIPTDPKDLERFVKNDLERVAKACIIKQRPTQGE